MQETNPFLLKGKNAIVTGGLGILGRKFCQALAQFGANVAIIDLDKSKLDSYSKELQDSYGVQATGIVCDVSSLDSVQRMIQQVIEQFNDIHILLNNAASKSSDLDQFFAPFEEYSLEQWRKIMSVNVDGMFLVAQAVGKQMVTQGKGGTIIQTASIYGVVGPDQRIYKDSSYNGRAINTPAVYSVSKAAVVGLSKYLATYWGDKGIRVNTLIPGGVESGQNEAFKEHYASRVPLGRMAQPDELVGAVLYLASDASSYVNGQEMIVDGGLTAW